MSHELLNLTHRKATVNDLEVIITLLFEDEFGKTRERQTPQLDERYIEAFHRIDSDSNQYLMVVEQETVMEQSRVGKQMVGTCHLTIMPSLTFIDSTRLQIEAVHVAERYRGNKIGAWMMRAAILYGKSRGATIIQLTTNKKRSRAKQFYERLGFIASHEGMKLYL